MSLKNALFIILLFVFSGSLHAQSEFDSETLEARARIEDQITQRLQTTIATVLDKDAFRVTVRVGLAVKKPEVVEPKKIAHVEKAPTEAMPGDITTGILNSEALVREYEEQLEKMRARETTTAAQVAPKTYKITSVLVSVGLVEDLGDEYKHSFDEWLKNRMSKDFGKMGQYEVTQIKKAPSIREAERSRTFFEKLASLQNFLGLLVLGIFSVIALLISKLVMSREAAAQIQVATVAAAAQTAKTERQAMEPPPAPAIEQGSQKSLFGGPGGRGSNTSIALDLGQQGPRSSGETMIEIRGIREAVAKISILVDELGPNVKAVFETWLQSGDRGRMKVAALTDALLTIQHNRAESFVASGGVAASLPPTFNFAIPPEIQPTMIETYQKMSDLVYMEKRRLLDEVYWDLVSLRSVGEKALDRPFGYIGQLKSGKIQNVLEQQNATVRALAVLHMNDDVKKKYVDGLTPDKKVELLQESLRIETIKTHELETTNETLRYVVKGATQTSAGEIDLSPLVPKLLNTFSVVEETQLLRDVAGKLSDKGYRLKLTWPTLAFLDEWPEEYLATLIKAAASDEIYALLRTVPKLKDQVLKQCPPRVAQIVSDDLTAQERMKPDEREMYVARLKNRLLKMVNEETLKLRDIFDPNMRPVKTDANAA